MGCRERPLPLICLEKKKLEGIQLGKVGRKGPTTFSSVAAVTNGRNPGLNRQRQRCGLEVRKPFPCRLWGAHPWSLILCDFSARLSNGKRLGGDPVMQDNSQLLVVASLLMVKINHPAQRSAGWLQGSVTLLVPRSPVLLFKIGLRITGFRSLPNRDACVLFNLSLRTSVAEGDEGAGASLFDEEEERIPCWKHLLLFRSGKNFKRHG